MCMCTIVYMYFFPCADKKFSTKARLHGTLPCVHVLLQDLQHNHQEAGDIIVAINTVRTLSSSSEYSVSPAMQYDTDTVDIIVI